MSSFSKLEARMEHGGVEVTLRKKGNNELFFL